MKQAEIAGAQRTSTGTPAAAGGRAVLPTRRPNLTLDTAWQGHDVTVTVGFDPATAEPREVFANTPRGGAMQATLADACVLISIALQHGIALAALGKSLAREPDLLNGAEATVPASPVGAIIEAMLAVA